MTPSGNRFSSICDWLESTTYGSIGPKNQGFPSLSTIGMIPTLLQQWLCIGKMTQTHRIWRL